MCNYDVVKWRVLSPEASESQFYHHGGDQDKGTLNGDVLRWPAQEVVDAPVASPVPKICGVQAGSHLNQSRASIA